MVSVSGDFLGIAEVVRGERFGVGEENLEFSMNLRADGACAESWAFDEAAPSGKKTRKVQSRGNVLISTFSSPA